MTVSNIFIERPARWGLRGDPGLWEAMHDYFTTKPLPYSTEQFIQDFRDCFKELCGCRLGSEKGTYVQQFNRGGMSEGSVSHRFWIERALPMLLIRLEAANNPTKDESVREHIKAHADVLYDEHFDSTPGMTEIITEGLTTPLSECISLSDVRKGVRG